MHLQRIDLVTERPSFRYQRLGVLASALALGDVLRDRVPARLDLLDTLDDPASLGVERQRMIHQRAARCEHVPATQSVADYLGLLAKQMQVVHGVSSTGGRVPAICSRNL